MKTLKIWTKNATYQKLEVLKTNRNKRHKYNEFIVEGVRNINEAVKNNWRIHSFLYSHEKPLSPWATELLAHTRTEVNYEMTNGLLGELSGKVDSSELMMVVGMKNNKEMEERLSQNPILVLFDRPSNKGNLGTMLRSCDALGIERLIITGHAVDVYDPDVIAASMGSFFSVPFMRLSDYNDIDRYIKGLKLEHPSLKIIGTTSHPKTRLYEVDMTDPVLLLIGNETDGLNRRLTEMSDVLATIPMAVDSRATSLNVSCAATVMFYEAKRQRVMKQCHTSI